MLRQPVAEVRLIAIFLGDLPDIPERFTKSFRSDSSRQRAVGALYKIV
jgi:hypothetical protein